MSYKYCACGIHVQNGAFAIAIFTLVASLTLLLFGSAGVGVAVNRQADELLPAHARPYSSYALGLTIGGLVENALFICVAILLIYGNRSRRPAFYWPYILFAFINLFFSLLRIIIFVFLLLYAATQNVRGMTAEGRESSVIALASASTLLTFAFLVQLYFLWVVCRSRRFLIEERRLQKSVAYHTAAPWNEPYYTYSQPYTYAAPRPAYNYY